MNHVSHGGSSHSIEDKYETNTVHAGNQNGLEGALGGHSNVSGVADDLMVCLSLEGGRGDGGGPLLLFIILPCLPKARATSFLFSF